MNEQEIIDLMVQAIWLSVKISAPIMIIGLVVGVAIALLQALTQIQEVTLVFVPKIISIFVAMIFLLPAFTTAMIEYMHQLADKIVALK